MVFAPYRPMLVFKHSVCHDKVIVIALVKIVAHSALIQAFGHCVFMLSLLFDTPDFKSALLKLVENEVGPRSRPIIGTPNWPKTAA